MRVVRALPVSGDAFLYEAGDFSVLVDGGKSSSRLAKLLRKHRPRLTRLDVVICTHADLDHSGGLKSLLDHWQDPGGRWKGRVGEFWLPGRWQSLARRSLTETNGMLDDFIADLDDLPEKDLGPDEDDDADDRLTQIIEAWGRGAAQGDGTAEVGARPLAPAQRDGTAAVGSEGQQPLLGGADVIGETETAEGDDCWKPCSEALEEPKWLRELREKVEEVLTADEKRRRQFALARRRIRYRMGAEHLSRRNRPSPGIYLFPRMGQHILKLLDTLEAIHDIALSALAHHVPIRWFDYRSFEKTGIRRGGLPGVLVPMNCSQQTVPVAEPLGVLYMASLTVVNRESLVFYSPGGRTSAGLMFCADSRLGSGWGQRVPFPPYRSMRHTYTVMTAPHHGSETNALAYLHAKQHYNPIAWVRSDNGGSVGPTFKRQWARVCTGCKVANYSARIAAIALDGCCVAGWPCDCGKALRARREHRELAW